MLDEPMHPGLEAGLSDEVEGWRRYAAWLSERGSPRGAAILHELEHPTLGAEDETRKRLYAAVTRVSPAAHLARERSWQFEWARGYPRRASFLLAATRRRGVRDWVDERWQYGRVDPELRDAERAQLEHGLLLPELRFVTDLKLEISEFREHIPLVARLMSSRRWDHLERLRLEIAYYEPVWMGADVGDPEVLVPPREAALLMAALPRLRRLELVGHFLFERLDHPTLAELRLVGHLPVLDGGLVFDEPAGSRGLSLPALTRLELVAQNPSSGCGPPANACALRFDPARLPALAHLELHESDLGDEEGQGGVFETIARSAILPQLRTLRLKQLDVLDPDGDPLPTIQALAPRFSHLDRLVVEDASSIEVAPFGGVLVRNQRRRRR